MSDQNSIIKTVKKLVKREHIATVFILAFLFGHTFWGNTIKVDNTTILLLVLLLINPYIHLIKKIKIAGFEAEISHKEVLNVEKKVDASPEQKERSEVNEKMTKELDELLERDPQLALAKVRIEIESRLKSLKIIYLDTTHTSFKLSLRPTIKKLQQEEIISKELSIALDDVISLANRAFHGETVSKETALKIVDLAKKVIFKLDHLVIDKALSSSKTKIISKKELSSYTDANYELNTVIPYVKNPETRTYKLNQAELDAFLEGYHDYAEFLVKLKKIK